VRQTYRDLLPQRRECSTFTMRYGGQNTEFTITTGHYEDGEIGEVFVNGAKAGSEMESVTRDAAVLLSLAIQHGVPIKTIKHAITRDRDGQATTIIGAVIDKITEGAGNE
jgi:hypothetical protein